MRIVAGRTKAACRIVFIKADIHSLGDVRFWHKADIALHRSECPLLGVKRTSAEGR
jgi:hypothetical protein